MEGFGMTILESMAQGTPTIVSSIGVFKEICGESGIYFNEAEPEDLAAKLLDVLGGLNYKELSSMSLSKAASFSWNKSASKLASAYSKIV
jgi:alpha-1,3-rhamnosyl/mannosyltransferase